MTRGLALVSAMALLGLACAAGGRASATGAAAPPSAAVPTAAVAPAPPANPWADPARDVLVQHCGTCHRGDLATARKGALAVYDLTEKIWYARLRPDQYASIAERVRENHAVEPQDVATIEAFVGCALEGKCAAPSP
jgi:hypothetical protein